MSRKYHFLPASLVGYYSKNSFKELLDESQKYDGYVYWHISGNDGKRKHKILPGDICYIYYSKLPDLSSRILFVANVLESDYGNNESRKSICPEARDGVLYAKLKLKSVSLEDSEKFSLDNLRGKYKLINPKGQIGYYHVCEDKHKKLIEDIEKSINTDGTHGLKNVTDYFDNNYCLCFFKSVDKTRKHDTFVEANGFYYIERHHLVEQNLLRKYHHIKGLETVINDNRNVFKLCPNCHKEIHHGTKVKRREKVKALYESNKKFFDDNFKELKGQSNTIDWLYGIYNC